MSQIREESLSDLIAKLQIKTEKYSLPLQKKFHRPMTVMTDDSFLKLKN